MKDKLNLAIIGCGDYVQRWEAGNIVQSNLLNVKSLFDVNAEQAAKLQKQVGGDIVQSAQHIFNDQDVDIVCIFTPPWIRKDLMLQAASAGKHIIATKPLAPSVQECQEILQGVKNVRTGIFYGRTGNAVILTLKSIFEGGEIGKLALYKQDWIHHYPQWNDWATDATKNGGPFMDAMIHNLNTCRFLAGGKTKSCTFFSDNHAHDLKCNDTEFMKIDFANNASGHLFITWAADLNVFSLEGNDREHIDIWYMVTDKGWRVTVEEENGDQVIKASRRGEMKIFPVQTLDMNAYDAFADAVMHKKELRSDIISVQMACDDIVLLRESEKSLQQAISITV